MVEPHFDGPPSVGDLNGLSNRQFEDLFDALTAFYADYAPPNPPGLRVALPVLSTFSCPPTAYLNPALLYAHESASPDLMANWHRGVLDRQRRGRRLDTEELRRQFAFPLIWLERIAWLIKEQVVLPIPTDAGKWHRINFPQREQIEELSPLEVSAIAEVRRELAAISYRDEDRAVDWADHQREVEELLADTYRGELGELDHARHLSMDAVWAYQRGLADLQFSIDAAARPFPLSERDWLLFRLGRREIQMSGLENLDLRVINGLATLRLPLFGSSGRHTRDLLAARRDEPAFEEWRAGLRRAVRTIESSPPGTEFEITTKQALEDELLPLTEEVRRATSKSAALSRASADAAFSLSVGAGVMTGAGLVGNFDPTAALAGMAVGSFGRVAAAYLLAGRNLQGRQRFVSAYLSALEAPND